MSGKQTISGRREAAIADRIFVRGLVLPIAIGVYDEEQGITQKVRFTIEADMGHNSWNRVYAGQDLYDWFLTHQRTDVR